MLTVETLPSCCCKEPFSAQSSWHHLVKSLELTVFTSKFYAKALIWKQFVPLKLFSKSRVIKLHGLPSSIHCLNNHRGCILLLVQASLHLSFATSFPPDLSFHTPPFHSHPLLFIKLTNCIYILPFLYILHFYIYYLVIHKPLPFYIYYLFYVYYIFHEITMHD